MKNYVEVAYNKKDKPVGEYPKLLADYICARFGLTPGMKSLDNGCGRGDFVKAFAASGLDSVGTDISAFYDGAVVCDLEKGRLPFEDDLFDLVFTKSVIEHLSLAENFLNEMYRVLKPGGVLVLMTPDWETQYKIFYQDPTHVHPYTVKSIERLLAMWDFEQISVEKFCQLPSVWTGALPRLFSSVLRLLGPVKKVYKNKFFRFSRELMVMGSARKPIQSPKARS